MHVYLQVSGENPEDTLLHIGFMIFRITFVVGINLKLEQEKDTISSKRREKPHNLQTKKPCQGTRKN